MKKANIISSIIGMLFAAAAFIKTLTFKKFTNVPVGPEFFPRVMAVALFICCLVLLILTLVKKDNGEKAPTLSPLNKDMQRCLLGLLVIIVYALLWNVIGFIIATPIALFVMFLILGKRNWGTMIIASLVATAIIFCAFKFLLKIEMPMGFLEDLVYAIEELFDKEDEEEVALLLNAVGAAWC